MTPLLTRALAFLRAHWQPAAAVGLVCLAFVWGRSCAPTKVETKTVEHTSYVDREVKVQAAAVVQVQEHVVYRDRTVIRRVNGTVVQRDIERVDTGHSTATAAFQVEDHTVFRDRVVMKEVRVDTPLNWHVSALVGALVNFKPLGLGPVTYGVAVERRVLGPVFVGVWGLSSGAGGLSLGVGF